MEFKECLFGRRSIRKFTNEVVSNETIREIINAGIYAPNACNFEAWKFIVITNDTANKKMIGNNIAINAPYGILVVYRNNLYVSGKKYNDYYQSAAAAIENMLLYITSIKLGAVWLCDLPKPKVLKKAFNIPNNFDVIGYIAFGHYNENDTNSKKNMTYHYGDEESFKEHKRRYNLDQVICNNSFYIVDGDCTHTKYPTKKKLIKKTIKDIIKKIIKK